VVTVSEAVTAVSISPTTTIVVQDAWASGDDCIPQETASPPLSQSSVPSPQMKPPPPNPEKNLELLRKIEDEKKKTSHSYHEGLRPTNLIPLASTSATPTFVKTANSTPIQSSTANSTSIQQGQSGQCGVGEQPKPRRLSAIEMRYQRGMEEQKRAALLKDQREKAAKQQKIFEETQVSSQGAFNFILPGMDITLADAMGTTVLSDVSTATSTGISYVGGVVEYIVEAVLPGDKAEKSVGEATESDKCNSKVEENARTLRATPVDHFSEDFEQFADDDDEEDEPINSTVIRAGE